LLRPSRRILVAPTDRAARFIDDRSDSVSGRFSISTTLAQLSATRFLHVFREKASRGLALNPTDLSPLLTEQIAHFCPLMRFSWLIRQGGEDIASDEFAA
jgi:hypothetical protein